MSARRRTATHVALAVATAFVLRAALGLALEPEPTWDGVIYERAARLLAGGEGYTVRMYAPGWRWALPTAFYPPGWPMVLAGLKLAQVPTRADLLLQSLLGALTVASTACVGGRASGHRGARFAAWAVALWPGGVALSASWMGEPLFTLGLSVAVLPLLRPRVRFGYALSALMFGALAYVRPTALAIAVTAIGARAWIDARGTPRRRARRITLATLAVALAVLPLAPWLARNHARLGRAAITTNGGANLYVGTLSPRFVRIPAALDCPAGPRERARDRCFTDRALRRIEADPVAWLGLGVLKLLHTFGYEASPALQLAEARGVEAPARDGPTAALIALSTAYWLALVALALGRRPRPRPAARAVVLAAALALAVVHFVYLGGDRYHLPLVPLVAALGAWPRLSSPGAPRLGPRRESRARSG